MKNDDLGTRMKGYESVTKTNLIRRTPTIIRLDGKAFHTWTKDLNRPFDDDLHHIMNDTAKFLIGNIQNAVLAYTQSDEISILLNDWKRLTTEQWFNANVQKIVSVSSSLATAKFNSKVSSKGDMLKPWAIPRFKKKPLAFFDSRVFNIPVEEVVNYFIWRQQDATRNSIQMLAQSQFSHKHLQGKNTSQLQDMLMLEKGINWNDIDVWKKRGSCVKNGEIDNDIPIFTKDRDYISELLSQQC